MTLQLCKVIFKDNYIHRTLDFLYVARVVVTIYWCIKPVVWIFGCGFASVGMLPAVYCRLESSALPYRTETCEWNWVTGGNLQAMLVLQTIQKNTPKKDGDVITRLNVSQTASQCAIWQSERKCEVKGEGESGRKRKVMDPTVIQSEQTVQRLPHFKGYTVRQQYKTSWNIFIFMLKTSWKNRDQFRYFWLSLCTRMAFHS